MQALLPTLLDLLLSTSPTSQQAIDNRIFLALTRVVQTLPELDTLPDCIKAANQEAALVSTFRMQCVHAILQRGSAEKSRMSPGDQERWTAAEEDFMKLLSGA
jgi:hypothetical protein